MAQVDVLLDFASQTSLRKRTVGPPYGDLIYSATFEVGNFSELGPNPFSISGNADGAISTDFVHDGTKSLALSVTNAVAGTGVRARIDNNIIPGYSGGTNLPDEAIYGAWFYIPTHISMNNQDAWNIFQFKQTYDTGTNYTRRALESIRPWERGGNRYGFVFKSRIDDADKTWDEAHNFHPFENEAVTVTAGEWFHLEYQKRWSQDAGLHKVWINGQVIGEVTWPGQVDAWDSWGNWRRQWAVNNYVNSNNHNPSTHTLYVDGLTIHEVA